jgi:hypothetical protein
MKLILLVYLGILAAAIATGISVSQYVFTSPSENERTLSGSRDTGSPLAMDTMLSPSTLAAGSTSAVIVSRLDFVMVRESPGRTPLSWDIPEEVCVDEIYIIEVDGQELHRSPVEGVEFPLCLSRSGDPLTIIHPDGTSETSWYFSFASSRTEPPMAYLTHADRGHFWYPYDEFTATYGIEAWYHLIRQGEPAHSIRQPSVNERRLDIPNPQGWDINYAEGQYVGPDNYPEFIPGLNISRITILRFERPLFERILYPSVTLVVLLFIMLLAFVRSTETFIEGGVGVFFGIFGLRQVILPSTVSIRTIMDYAIGGLYFAFAVVLIFHVLRNLNTNTNRWLFGTGKHAADTSGLSVEEAHPLHRKEGGTPPSSRDTRALVAFVLVLTLVGWVRERFFGRRR